MNNDDYVYWKIGIAMVVLAIVLRDLFWGFMSFWLLSGLATRAYLNSRRKEGN